MYLGKGREEALRVGSVPRESVDARYAWRARRMNSAELLTQLHLKFFVVGVV